MVSNNPNNTAGVSHQKLVDVSSMFVGIESLFPEVIDSLYVGRLAWPSQYNKMLKSVYDSLDLKVKHFDMIMGYEPNHELFKSLNL
jgi:hypothetical protein